MVFTLSVIQLVVADCDLITNNAEMIFIFG